ncbi:nicotinate-nucleotide adenylyltransferase [Actinomycetaceae bacterium TAE3-ERU4]|nr:nicotinate-nucleotide adenylyltransferase [Actinomycetaceae bacterium TAE3-ERU4]
MGGTFDPIHHGHLVAASGVQAAFGLDEVIFVPAATQPFKRGRKISSAEHRYLMTVIATASNPSFSVSRVDIDRGGVTYTVDTLKDLFGERDDIEPYFITGADALERIMEWRDSDKLLEMANFVGVTRPGYKVNSPLVNSGKVNIVEIPALAISSTDCRARVERGEPVWYLVPDGVVQYINKYGLYTPEVGLMGV